MDSVGQTTSGKKSCEIYFYTVELTYVYGQLPLSPVTRLHFNFSIVGGNSIGTYRIKIGIFCLTTMPAEFHRVMNSISAEYPMMRLSMIY